MAYWNIRFKSRDGNTYLIQIDGKTGNTDVDLQGAEEPFSTEEKDTDDIFIPVITESGYISINDDGKDLAGNAFDYHDLIPQVAKDNSATTPQNRKDRPVTVYKILPNQQSEVWRGYLQPQTFQGEYLAEGQERKFPVVNSLSVLEAEDVDPEAYSGAVNFARLIYYLTQGFVVEYQFQGSDAFTWLLLNINWSIFADVEDNEETAYGVTFKPKYNKLQALEEVCRFFGWTCRQKDRTLYFSSPDSDIADTWVSCDDQEFADLGDGVVPDPGYPAWKTLNLIGSNKFASDDNNEMYLPGIKKATVTADTGENQDLPAFETQAFERYLDKYVQYPEREDYSQLYFFYMALVGIYPTEDSIFNFQQMTDPTDATKNVGVYYQQFEYFKGSYTALQHKHNYSWSTRIAVKYNNLSGGNYPLFSMKSRYPVSFAPNDLLAISATTYHDIKSTNDGQTERKQWRAAGNLWCKLRIGDFYYDGYNWVRFQSQGYWESFPIPVGSEDNNYEQTGSIISNRFLDSNYAPYEGLGLYMPQISIGGIMEFQICGYDCTERYVSGITARTELAHSLNIENLKMEKVRQRESFLPRPSQKENKYVADLGKVFDTEREESTTFASYNNIDGNNVIMDSNLGYVSEINYSADGGGYTAHPEQHLADRIANFHRRPRRMLELELDTADIGDVAPDYKVQDYLNRTYYPLVIGHEWREGITKLKMIEL